MKVRKNKVIGIMIVVAVLAGVFWWGDNAPGLHGTDAIEKQEVSKVEESPSKDKIQEEKTTTQGIEGEAVKKVAKKSSEKPGGSEGGLTANEKVDLAAQLSGEKAPAPTPAKVKDQYDTAPVPTGKPVPVEPQHVAITDEKQTCTMSVRCDTILDNMDWLDSEKSSLVPTDGVIFPSQTVTFYKGESVFNVLLREMKQNKIHMEYMNTPIYNSAYIEGIHNLYEYDCGELSGWMYKVNDWFPNYGSSRYQLEQGDVVEWVYTCTLGADVGKVL
ncbi:MAG: DUF4430 domain-containing protein [Anaerovorax sp.]